MARSDRDALATEKLVSRARSGDASAFEALAARYASYAAAIGSAHLSDPEDVRDIVQDAFFEAWQDLKRLHDARTFRTWLGRIVRNRALDRGRRLAVRAAERAEPAGAGAAAAPAGPRETDPAAAAEARETAALVRAGLAEVEATGRECLALRHVAGLSCAEIAEALGLTRSAVESRLFRARMHLRRALKKRGLVGGDRTG